MGLVEIYTAFLGRGPDLFNKWKKKMQINISAVDLRYRENPYNKQQFKQQGNAKTGSQ